MNTIEDLLFDKWYYVANLQFWKDRIDERYGYPNFYLDLSPDYTMVRKRKMFEPKKK